MLKWVSIIAMLILFLGFSNGKVAESEALSPPAEIDIEAVNFPTLKVYAGHIHTENTTSTVLNNHCWKEQNEGNCYMKLTFPSKLLNRIPPLKVKQEEKVILVLSTTDSSSAFLLEPDEIEVTQIKLDEKVSIEEIEVTDYEITTPKESGKYHYSVVFHWNELQLQASYIFDVIVQ